MNNNQFRKLLLDTPARQNNGGQEDRSLAAGASLGTKRSSFVPMTPRTASGTGSADFARQVRERHASLQPSKKFKSSAPKGSKFGSGYVDRAKARTEVENSKDDKAERIKALEEQVKLGQLDMETFQNLRDEIAGGDISSTHLVKGLDRKLLERVRRGEDVLGVNGEANADVAAADVDEELDKLQELHVQEVHREKVEKKGSMAPPPIAGVKRSRDEIMAEFKAQRKAAAAAKAAAAPKLDDRWRKVGQKEKAKIEIDHKGREVLIVVDEHGKVKKKIRRAAVEQAEHSTQTDVLDANKPILGADAFIPDLPKHTKKDDDDDDDDIFAGVGVEYDPLGEDDDDDDSDDSDDSNDSNDNDANRNDDDTTTKHNDISPLNPEKPAMQPGDPDASKTIIDGSTQTMDAGPRNYFKDAASTTEQETQSHFGRIEDVLKKAAKLGANVNDEGDNEDGGDKAERDARLAKRARMLSQQDRDMDDMDLGFGSSRYGDEDEGDEGKKVRLSQWNSKATGDEEGWEDGEEGNKKKRKPKKRKGDANNVADIMRVIESRKAGNK